MNKKTVISTTDNTILKLKVLAKKKESARSKLAVTAKEKEDIRRKLAITAKEKESVRNKLVVTAKQLAITAKEKETVRRKLAVTAETLRLKAKQLAAIAKEKESIRGKLEVTAKQLAIAAKEKETVRSKLAVIAKEKEDIRRKLAITAKEKESVRNKLVVIAKQLAITAKEKETVRRKLAVTAKEKEDIRRKLALTARQLAVTAKEIESANKELLLLDKAKDDFISIASHQLRTPVSGLSWLTEALQFASRNLDPKQKGYIKDLATLSKRLIDLIEDLLNFSRIELKTTVTTEKQQVEISGFIEKFIKEIELYATSKKHSVIFNRGVTEPIAIEINQKSFYNVLQNLVSNAIEYSPENTAVTISLEKTDDIFLKISVSNKGSLISKKDQPHIFERFYRAEDAKKIKPEGTGLGLYIVKKIIEDTGGKVGFKSEEGRDTMFWFTIPLKMTNKTSAPSADSSAVK